MFVFNMINSIQFKILWIVDREDEDEEALQAGKKVSKKDRKARKK